MMSAPPDLRATEALQHAFASHLRDPARAPVPPGIEPRRMAVYAELFFNNVESLITANFPVIRSLYDDASWRTLIRAFYRDHRCHTPIFPEIARELIRYLESLDGAAVDGVAIEPFLVELAHYEWSELALSLDEAELSEIACDAAGDVVDGVPLASPLARVLAYRFPVHRISPDFRPAQAPAQPTLILLTRDRDDDLHFLEIDPLTALLVERLQRNDTLTGRAVLNALLAELGRDDAALRESGLATLRRLRERDALLGTLRA